jgi:peptide/nickel transport system substrate-binding protein
VHPYHEDKLNVSVICHMDDNPPAPDQTPPKVDANGDSPTETVEVTRIAPQPAVTEPSSTQPAVGVPPQAVVVNQGGGRKRWLRLFIILLVVAALGIGGWFLYQKHKDDSKAVTSSSQSKEIPLLKIGIKGAAYGSLYPDMSPSSYSFLTNSQIFEGLVRYENKSKIVPALASNWTNPDSKTWTFTVKNGVKFHDGHTLTAKDVKYSLDTVIASDSELAQTFASTISTVEVVGNNQVKIMTNVPDPTLLNRLAFLYVIDANLPKDEDPSMAGTGPYKIKPGAKPTDKNVQMVAVNNYHGGTPKVRALSFGYEDDSASLIKAFKAHEYNIIGAVPVDQVTSVKGATEFISSEPDTDYIGFNTVKPGPLQNKLVREAIRYAADPEAIGKARGNQITPLSQLIPESIPGYNPSINPYKRDVAKAKKLLTEAGYPNGVTLRFSTTDSQEVVDEITTNLKEAGITLTLDRHPDFDEFIDYFSSGKAELYSVEYSSDTLDGLDIYNTTLDSANYNNPKLTALLNQAGATVDPAKRLKLLQDAAVVIDQDVAIVPLSTENSVWLLDKNYVIQQDMPSSFISVYFYKVHAR